MSGDYEYSGYEAFKDSIAHERERIAEWKSFYAETGHWPVLSIVFHYIFLAILLSGVGALTLLIELDVWELGKTLLVGGSALVVFVVLALRGETLVERFEENRFRRE